MLKGAGTTVKAKGAAWSAMRGRALLVLTLLLAASLPVQAEEVNTQIMDDDSNDVVIQNPDGTVTQPDGGTLANVDIVGVGVFSEDDDQITFYIDVKNIDSQSQHPAPFHDPDYHIYFRYGDQGYRVMVATALQNPVNDAFARSGQHFGQLQIQATETNFRSIAEATIEVDHGDDRVLVSVPRDGIVDENQAGLGIGATLSHIWATAQSGGWFQFPITLQQGGEPTAYFGLPYARDQAPDELSGTLPTYTMTTGPIKARGGLVAASADPVRWTNGEASTLVFDVQITNTAERDIPVSVDVARADYKWTLDYSDAVTVPKQDSVNVTFLVTIPFSHNHGALHMFEATFTEPNRDAFAATELGVYWPAVPQPAGHHDKLWVHSMATPTDNPLFGAFNSGVHGWMSAIEEEEADESMPIPSMFTVPPNPFTGGSAISFWRIELEPELRMGLDFRPEELGSAEIAIDFPATVVDPVVHIELSHVKEIPSQGGRFGNNGGGQRTETELASASASAPGPVSGRQVFPVELTITDDADDIPYDRDVNLVLDVIVEATFIAGFGNSDPAGIAPKLMPGATWMQLPLNEYETPLDISFQTDGTIELVPGNEGVQRYVNPGKTTVYTFDVTYLGSEAATLTASLTGPNSEWATMVGDQEFEVQPGSTRTIGFAVAAPKDARAGERADVTLTLMDKDNAAVQAGINTRSVVATDEEIPDEAHRAEDLDAQLSTDKESPGPSLVLLLAAILLARRRD